MTDKYSRLVTFVINICPKPLRELFISKARKDKNIRYTNLKDYLVFREQDIRTLERRNKITTDQLDHIFPASGIVDIQKWDVTLSSALLKGLFKTELNSDERFCLDTITTIRNTLQHIPSTKCIEDKLFDSSWNDLKNAVLSLSKYAGAPDQRSIEEEISKALTENMPNLGDVLQTWYKGFTVQLSLQNKRLEKKLNEQASEIQNVRATSEKGKAILLKGTRKRPGRSGAAVKAFNIYDKKVDNMKGKFKRGFDKPSSGSEFYQDRIKLITKQLNENHRVIVTGNDNDLNYKCAFAAIKGTYQCIDQCLETSNPSDWRSISFEDAKLVLFNEPFGRFKFDERKYEAMFDEFDGMLDATQGEDDDTIDIIIVANQKHLKEATDRSDHEMLCTSSVVEIDSSNIDDMAKTFKKSYIPKAVDSQAKENAKRLFIDQSMGVIVGPTGSGKTSLSFELLPLYDLSNGEDNFVVICDPSELKFVNLSLHPVIIIKSLCGVKFNHAEAHRWYSQLDRLYAAVKENQIAVIITIESKVFQMIQSNMPPHQLLACTVTLTSSSVNERENGGKDTIDCEVQTDDISLGVLPEGNSTQAGTIVDENNQSMNVLPEEKNTLDETQTCDFRSVRDIRKCGIVYGSKFRRYDSWRTKVVSVFLSPSGFLLLVNARYYDSYPAVIKLDTLYKAISDLELDTNLSSVNSCYNSHNDLLVVCGDKNNEYKFNLIIFVDVKDKMSLNKSVSITQTCRSLTCHSDKLYLIDKDSVYIYSIDGEFIETLYKKEKVSDKFCVIEISNDGSMIYILNNSYELITINSSGNHLYTLNILEPGRFLSSSIEQRVCVDDQGNVFILPEESKLIKIIQVSPNGEKCYGVLFQFDSNIEYVSIVFDSKRSALVLVGKTKEVMVLTLR